MITFAPSFTNYRKHVAGAVPALIIVLVIDYWRVHQPLPVYVTECVALVGLGLAFAWLYFRNTRLSAERHSLTIRNLFGVDHEIAGDRLAKAVFVQQLAVAGNASPTRLIVFDDGGKAVVRWTGLTWTTEQMHSLVETLAIPLETVPEPITIRKLRERYPHAVSALGAHPYSIGIVAGLVIVAVVIGVVLALNPPS